MLIPIPHPSPCRGVFKRTLVAGIEKPKERRHGLEPENSVPTEVRKRRWSTGNDIDRLRLVTDRPTGSHSKPSHGKTGTSALQRFSVVCYYPCPQSKQEEASGSPRRRRRVSKAHGSSLGLDTSLWEISFTTTTFDYNTVVYY